MNSGKDNARWFQPCGTLASGDWAVNVETRSDWQHTGLLVGFLISQQEIPIPLAGWEAIVVPLAGGVQVAGPDIDITLTGRRSVFAGPTDVAYLPAGAAASLVGTGSAKIAICLARSTSGGNRRAVRLDAADVPVELRGAGIASREVRNFGVPAVLDADAIIACEVLTPAGNWSSWPPHKHDEHRDDIEAELEEIYYVQTRATGDGNTDPVGYQRVYGTAERPIDVLAEVRTDDVVLVPHGWHGPAIAAPDADLYYLNVMAGPGDLRAWQICDDPAHTAVRTSWAGQPVDARLPFGRDA